MEPHFFFIGWRHGGLTKSKCHHDHGVRHALSGVSWCGIYCALASRDLINALPKRNWIIVARRGQAPALLDRNSMRLKAALWVLSKFCPAAPQEAKIKYRTLADFRIEPDAGGAHELQNPLAQLRVPRPILRKLPGYASLKQEKDPIPIDPINAEPVHLNGENPLGPAIMGLGGRSAET